MENSSLKPSDGRRFIRFQNIFRYLHYLSFLAIFGGFFWATLMLVNEPYIFSGEDRLVSVMHRLHRDTGMAVSWLPQTMASSGVYTLTIRRKAPNDLGSVILGRIPLFPAVNLWNPVENITRDELKQMTQGNITHWSSLGGRERQIVKIQGMPETLGRGLASQRDGFAWLDWSQLHPGVKVLSIDGVNPLWQWENSGYPYWGWVVLTLPHSSRRMPLISGWRQQRLLTKINRQFSARCWLFGEERATLTATGDMLFDRGVSKTVSDKSQGYAYLFEKTAEHLLSADLTLGNLECPLSDRGQQINMFRGEPAAADALRKAGFDLLSLANNHILDYGIGAFTDTLSNLHQQGITALGVGHNLQEAGQSSIQMVNGVPLAFLAFTEVRPGFTYSRVPLNWKAGPHRPGVNPLSADTDLSEILRAKRRGCVVIVSVHWGTEYQEEPDGFQRRMGERLKAAGADLIIGHHPHVTQGIAIGQQTVAYSLGNFIFDQKNPECKDGLILDALFDPSGLKLIRLHPVRIVRERPVMLRGYQRRIQIHRIQEASERLGAY